MKIQKKVSNGYAVLLSKVRKTLIEGQRHLEQERVRTYWETGDHIFVHILKYQDRADYGEEVLGRLADDIELDATVLRRCLQFREKYPHRPIRAGRREFNWSHYRELITISDDKKRLSLERAAIENGWTSEELAARKRSGNDVRSTPSLPAVKPRLTGEALHKPLTPLRGILYTYQIVKRPSVNADSTPELRVDLGFGVFHKVDSRLLSGFAEGDIVESQPKEDAYKFYKTSPPSARLARGGRTVKDLYTYAAFIERVIDADTLKVRFDLGFNTEARQTLRLRGIDCPELDTKGSLPAGRQGQAAKAFVQSYIKEAQLVIVRSSRSDKYDRYLADVFIPQGEEPDSSAALRTGPQTDIYLNNLLLEHGHAVRME